MRSVDPAKLKRPAAVNPGPAPMLQWLRIEHLVIDDSYQRDLKAGNWKAIQRIADGFKWSRFSPVFVAPVEGGRFAIIDGQHRAHAAAICGFAEVPCQVVQMDREEQAASFADVNGAVTKVTVWNIYKAALAAREDWAVLCHDACRDAGCQLMAHNGTTDTKRAGQIYAIGLVRGYVRAGAGKVVTLTLKGIRKSAFGETAEAYSNEILKPLFAAVGERPWLIRQNVDLSPFIDDFDVYAVLDRAEDFVKAKRRQGFGGISRFDVARAEIGEGLDKAFPQRIALPKPVEAA
ncbi:ParB N-terminal domain-containing protein [Mesorhizobium sp. CAU 1741]|uniref:ParB N-terminal domain-containing protein n=1 Tax=Mesorhizobium sp. CAU 1741 TaxID=3140366 RepID=UPI00325B29AA